MKCGVGAEAVDPGQIDAEQCVEGRPDVEARFVLLRSLAPRGPRIRSEGGRDWASVVEEAKRFLDLGIAAADLLLVDVVPLE